MKDNFAGFFDKMSEKQCLWALFLLCFTIRFVMALFSHPVSYISDEISSISAAAIAAGKPWKDVVSSAGYYGFGFLIIFAPLFMLNLKALTIYRVMLTVLAVVDAAGAIICFCVQRRFFPELSRVFCLCTSFLCFSFLFFCLPDVNVRNENILVLLAWLLTYCVCLLVRREHMIAAQVGAAAILIYAQTVHTRAVVLVVGFVAVYVFLFILYRRKLVSLPCLAVILAGTVVIKKLVSLYIASIWQGGARNSSVAGVLSRSAGKVHLSFTYLSCVVRIGLGQLFTASATSLGLFMLSTVALLLFILRWRNIKKGNNRDVTLLVLGIMFLINIALTIGGQSLSWSNGVYSGVQAETYVYYYKAFTYLRYFGFNVPPMVMAGMIVCKRNKNLFKRALVLSGLILAFLAIVWIRTIMPLIVTEDNYYYKLIMRWKRNSNPGYLSWLLTVLIMMSIMIVWGFLLIRGKWYFVMTATAIFMSLGMLFQFFSVTVVSQKKSEKLASSSALFLQSIEKVDPAEEIYCHDGRGKKDHQNYFISQFLNYEKHVIPGLPAAVHDKDYIVFSDRNIQGYFEYGYWWVKLDNDEYVFFSNEKIVDYLSQNYVFANRVMPAPRKMLFVFYNVESKDHFYTVRNDEVRSLTNDPYTPYVFLGTAWMVDGSLTPNNVPVYRFFDRIDKNHIYTASQEKRLEYRADVGRYHEEGIAWYSPMEGEPVYCLYNAESGDTYLTVSKKECDQLLKNKKWTLEEMELRVGPQTKY